MATSLATSPETTQPAGPLSAFGKARSTIAGAPLSAGRAAPDRRLLARLQLPGARG